MDIIKSSVSHLRHATSKTSSGTDSYILQLPVDILLKIFEYLPPHTQLMVYQTCRPLRAIIHHHFLAGKGDILATLENRLRYLTDLAKSMPDQWVCAKCCKIHKACQWDTPIYRGFSNLPPCGDGWGHFSRHSECRKFSNNGYSPSHRHVELTLKYARLESQETKHQEHLQRLLAPHHAESISSIGNTSIDEGTPVQRSFYPRVVDGRYLLLTVQTYFGAETTTSRQFLRFFEICPHLYSIGAYSTRNSLETHLDTIFREAFSAPPNASNVSSCLDCGTDICIQISPESVTVYAWQDLGPEATVYDPDWEAMVRDNTKVHHQTGSIQELYGQHEHKFVEIRQAEPFYSNGTMDFV